MSLLSRSRGLISKHPLIVKQALRVKEQVLPVRNGKLMTRLDNTPFAKKHCFLWRLWIQLK
jgi:hypothetical protein